MAFGIEGRPPFASRNIIDLRFRLSDADIYQEGHGKFIIKKLCEKYFGKKFAFRDKIGFSSPYGDWLSSEECWGSYWRFIDRELLGEYFHIAEIENLLALPNAEGKWTGINLNILFSILNFQLWHSLFFDNKKSEELLEAS